MCALCKHQTQRRIPNGSAAIPTNRIITITSRLNAVPNADISTRPSALSMLLITDLFWVGRAVLNVTHLYVMN